MAFNKKHQFDVDQKELADFAKAISHPARVAILQTLAERKSCVCGELVGLMPLAQSTVSQHLKELKEAGLVKGEIEGLRSCYCLDTANFIRLSDDMRGFLDGIRDSIVSETCCP
jgi:DNA-binding transcriptional ArsR family regulator